jgi:Macrocin-O-methyltransferase (TylF)
MGREPGGEQVSVVDSPTVQSPAADRTNLHRIWKSILIGIALVVATACYFAPVLLVALGALLLFFFCARLVYRGRDRYIPNLYARDIRVYDDAYRSFIGRTLSDLRRCRIRGHTLLREASRLPKSSRQDPEELLLDLGVWLGWSTRLISDASGRQVYGFDTFEGLVEDWQVDDQILIKRGTFSLSEPLAERFIRDTGVSLHDGLPAALGRKVQFVKGSTYETLAPFLADRPAAPIRFFHMDLDTYESCLHALETCKDRFIEGSILVFDEYLVTNGEMRAFYEFQSQYDLEWRYRAWGLEAMEMNVEMVTAYWKRAVYYLLWIAGYWLMGDGSYVWKFFRKRFWRFWLGAPVGDILFILGAAGQRKSVSLEITGLGKLDRSRQRD